MWVAESLGILLVILLCLMEQVSGNIVGILFDNFHRKGAGGVSVPLKNYGKACAMVDPHGLLASDFEFLHRNFELPSPCEAALRYLL